MENAEAHHARDVGEVKIELTQPAVTDAFLERAGAGAFCRGLIEELAREAPRDDAAVAEMLDGAVRDRDETLFTNVLFAALAAGRAVDARVLLGGAELLPEPFFVALAATHCSGDVASTLVELSKRLGNGWEHDAAALLIAGQWCSRRSPKAFPPELVSRARILARESRGNYLAQAQLLALAGILDSEQLRTLIPDAHGSLASIGSDLMLTYEKLASVRVIDEVPETPETPFSIGTTKRRAVPRISRNDPCPCGSGKKYKKCCFDKDQQRLRRSSDVAGVTVEELRANPEPFLSRDHLMSMRAYELARLDPARVPGVLRGLLIQRLLRFGAYEPVVRIFEIAGLSGELEGHWYDAVEFATIDGRKDIVRPLLRLHGIHKAEDIARLPDMGIGQFLLMTDEKPCSTLETIEASARAALADGAGQREADLAYALVEGGFPGLGILAGRAAIPLIDRIGSALLIGKILKARDELNLAPDEPFEGILDELHERRLVDADNETEASVSAQRELERTNAEARELRKEIERLHDDLKRRESAPVPVSPPAQPATEPKTPVPDPIVTELRCRVERLKAELNLRHDERNQLRRDLELTQSDLQKLKQRQATAETAREERDAEERENTLLEECPAGPQSIRVPHFSERFKKSIGSLPPSVVASALRLAGRLAAGDATAFTGCKRLRGTPSVMRQRIGIKHRLLFSVKGETLEVIDLVERKELEKAIRNFARNE